MNNKTTVRLCLLSAALCVVGEIARSRIAAAVPAGTFLIGGVALLALASNLSTKARGFAFSLWVGAFVAAAMVFPAAFLSWGGFELKRLIVPLIQLIMFGMGTMLSLTDFARVLQMPKAVLVGIVLQFTVMPLCGALLAAVFGMHGEVAAGIVLIGACPGGVASNVMTYISRGNVALSVTMTACSTLVSPLMTPLMMKLLAGQYVEIVFVDMMMTILEIIIVPIGAGLIANAVLRMLNLRGPWVDRLLSWLAMASICYIIAIITALSRDQLLSVGATLIAIAVIHNSVGYVLGYYGAAIAGLDESARRTVAIEVGLQNGGMASGLAVNVLKSSDAALASAIFGPWMNISGSVLASWWRSRPPEDGKPEPADNSNPDTIGPDTIGPDTSGAQSSNPYATKHSVD
ncbi:MAG: bile acid:sodium symporter family protein [Planctomycetaceae bacterium]